jgi:hypothetical protein
MWLASLPDESIAKTSLPDGGGTFGSFKPIAIRSDEFQEAVVKLLD